MKIETTATAVSAEVFEGVIFEVFRHVIRIV
jgi:hypothetical protein